MSGRRAKALRRELPPKLDFGPRPALYTHPINPDLPNRKERRAAHERLRQFIVTATRRRDTEAKRRGVPTPSEGIRAAIKRAGTRFVNLIDEPNSGWLLFEAKPKPNKFKPWRPT